MRRPAARLRAVVPLVVGCLLLAGCVSLPDDGPVVEAGSASPTPRGSGVVIDPRPPQPGDSPGEVVKGFLDAMTATPIRTDVARQFLTDAAQASWNPELETITYDEASTPRGTSRVSLTLSGTNRLDAGGAWLGSSGRPDETLVLPTEVEGDEYRISDPPDALIVPAVWFEQRYRQVSLYFFDPAARILVPEPVFVPRGEQLATSLVTGLLRGPGTGLGRVSSTFLPAGLSVDLSVPVDADGVADISLNGESGQLSDQVVELMVAQLAWTLRQEPSIRSFRLSIGGRAVRLGNSTAPFGVDAGAAYDPSGARATPLLFGLDTSGLMVSGQPTSLRTVSGPFGLRPYGLQDVAVSLSGTTAAGVVDGGASLLLAPVRGDGAVTQVVRASGGWTDLLPPAWDYSDRLWLVDRTAAGARVSYLDDTGSATDVVVPGVTGTDVRRFLVSRDGSRLVAVVRSEGDDRILVSRIRQDDAGGILSAAPATDISEEQAAGDRLRVRDLSWRSPTSIAVLHRVAQEFFEISTVSVDGSPAGPDALASTLRGRVSALVSSPATGEKTYALSGSTLVDQSVSGDAPIALDPGVASLDYAG